MESLQFGSLRVEESDTGIELHSLEGVKSVCRINTDEVPVLMNFLKRHLAESANRRSSWRLELGQLPDAEVEKLSVVLTVNGEGVEVWPLDISLTGLRVASRTAIAERGDQIAVTITLGETTAELQGTVVRQDQDMRRVALQFQGCMDERGNLTPPDELWEIFTELEHVWLDKKLGLQWS